jgi:hypothetical protein
VDEALNITIIQIKLKVDVIPINFIQCSCFPFGKTFLKMSITISWVLQYSSLISFCSHLVYDEMNLYVNVFVSQMKLKVFNEHYCTLII